MKTNIEKDMFEDYKLYSKFFNERKKLTRLELLKLINILDDQLDIYKKLLNEEKLNKRN